MVWMSDFESLKVYVDEVERNPLYQVPLVDISPGVSPLSYSIVKPCESFPRPDFWSIY